MAMGFFLENKWLRSGCLLSRGSGSAFDTYDVGLGPFQNWTKSEHEGLKSWFFPSDFFRVSQNDFYVARSQMSCEKSAILEALPEASPIGGSWEAPLPSEFAETFNLSMQKIGNGEIQKVVPVVFEKMQIELTESHVANLLRRGLMSSASGDFFAHWDLDKAHAVFGLTPELLFELDEYGQLKTMALAGTAGSDSHDLLEDPKEVAEHQLVVDAITAQLKSYGEVNVSETYEWKPSSLRHLRTDITARVGTNSHFNLIFDLHPTPALGGKPRQLAKDLLKKFAKQAPRFQFGAPFGVIDEIGSARFVVQIRCLIYRSGRLYLGSGCGLVNGSQQDREWAELQLKRDSVKKVFGLI